MTFQDCLAVATIAALDLDLPAELLPLMITNQAAFIAGINADTSDATWH